MGNDSIITKSKNSMILFVLIIVAFFMIASLASCDSRTNNKTNIITTTKTEEEENMNELILKIDGNLINVTWEDNTSVEDLKKLANNGLTINMHEYGGFEQTGAIGSIISSNDSSINVVPGDIVLYNSNQISVFYNNSRWSYTRLGHINLTNDELNELLNVDNVVVNLSLI